MPPDKLGRQGNLVIHRIKDTTDYMIWFMCPGCEEAHAFRVPQWTFNWNFESPTFSPSLLCQWRDEGMDRKCHLFLRDGQLQFLGDCTHDLAGQTVPLPEPPEWL